MKKFLKRITIYGETVVFSDNYEENLGWARREVKFWHTLYESASSSLLKRMYAKKVILTQQKLDSLLTLPNY